MRFSQDRLNLAEISDFCIREGVTTHFPTIHHNDSWANQSVDFFSLFSLRKKRWYIENRKIKGTSYWRTVYLHRSMVQEGGASQGEFVRGPWNGGLVSKFGKMKSKGLIKWSPFHRNGKNSRSLYRKDAWNTVFLVFPFGHYHCCLTKAPNMGCREMLELSCQPHLWKNGSTSQFLRPTFPKFTSGHNLFPKDWVGKASNYCRWIFILFRVFFEVIFQVFSWKVKKGGKKTLTFFNLCWKEELQVSLCGEIGAPARGDF